MIRKDNEKWRHLHNYLTKGYQFKGFVTKKAALRSSAKVSPTNKIGCRAVGTTVSVTEISANGKRGCLKKKSTDGKYRWIYLGKVKEE